MKIGGDLFLKQMTNLHCKQRELNDDLVVGGPVIYTSGPPSAEVLLGGGHWTWRPFWQLLFSVVQLKVDVITITRNIWAGARWVSSYKV